MYGPTLAAIAARGICPGCRVTGVVLPRRDRASKAVTVPAIRVRRKCHAGCCVGPVNRPGSPRATSSVVGGSPASSMQQRASYARRFAARGISPVPAWSVMPYPHPPRQQSCHGGCYPAPLHAVRVRQGSRQRSRWSRCHAPCWAAPGVPLRFPPRYGLVMPRACPRRLGRPRGKPSARPVSRRLRHSAVAGPSVAATVIARLRQRQAASLCSFPPRPAGRRAWQGAALGRAACARPAGAGLRFPPPAGPPSAGVRAERAGRSAAVLR